MSVRSIVALKPMNRFGSSFFSIASLAVVVLVWPGVRVFLQDNVRRFRHMITQLSASHFYLQLLLLKMFSKTYYQNVK